MCVWQLEDKREALAEFKDLSTVEPLRLIEKGGMSVLLALLRANDTQLTRDVLETLANLMDAEMPKGMAEAARVASVHNCGVFLTSGSNVSLVLGSVDGEDGGHGTSLPPLVLTQILTLAMVHADHGTSLPHHPACARACRPEPRACPCQARRTTCTSSSTRCS